MSIQFQCGVVLFSFLSSCMLPFFFNQQRKISILLIKIIQNRNFVVTHQWASCTNSSTSLITAPNLTFKKKSAFNTLLVQFCICDEITALPLKWTPCQSSTHKVFGPVTSGWGGSHGDGHTRFWWSFVFLMAFLVGFFFSQYFLTHKPHIIPYIMEIDITPSPSDSNPSLYLSNAKNLKSCFKME